MNPILAIICTIWFLGAVPNAEMYKALLFNRQTRTVLDLPKKIQQVTKNCEAWATACPASESKEEDEKFINDHSITKQALLVEKTYETTNLAAEVKQDICKTPFQMSAVYYLGNISVEFGYEVFHRAGEDDKYHKCTYENYRSLEEAARILRKEGLKKTKALAKFSWKTLKERTKKLFLANGGRKIYNQSWEMKLLWLPMFKIRFSFTNMMMSTVTYEIRRNSRWPITYASCNDYKLGSAAYEELEQNVGQLYKNQKKIFEKFILPPPSCTPNDQSCPSKNDCDSKNTCLEIWSLIPLDQFHLFSNTPLHCSYMSSVPIWTAVAKLALERLDKYLYALFRHLETPLHIIAGVKGRLELPLKKKSIWSSNNIVYLDWENKRIPASSIIYKIVKYKLPNCKFESKSKSKSDPEDDKFCEYSAIFVINNNPNFEPKNRLCKEYQNLVQEWGWDSLLTHDQNENNFKNIYVCPENQETLYEIFGPVSVDKPKTVPGNLNLKAFPFLSGDETEIIPRDIKEKVDKKYNELLTKGDDEMDYDDIVEISRGSLSDDDEDEVAAENLERRDDDNDDGK